MQLAPVSIRLTNRRQRKAHELARDNHSALEPLQCLVDVVDLDEGSRDEY